MGLVAVGVTGVGDDDRPVLEVRRSARGGFDGDVGRNTGENECVDACDAKNGAE